jgi:DNA-binding NtrC family response regulator
MERITLYHQGVPVSHHLLTKSSFSIGAHHKNDLVLAGRGVSDHHMVIYRAKNGRWRARSTYDSKCGGETDLDSGTRIALGSYSLEMELAKAENRPGREQRAVEQRKKEPQSSTIKGVSIQTRLLRSEISRLGKLGAPVLISGETGTGKELVAQGLHNCSCRSQGPFVVINCGGLTSSLLEDTLFGHERGSFTGALSSRKGVFEQAAGGTLFLDEIGELPLSQQAVLLRVLEDKKIRRIGQESESPVDFRLIAATNRDLLELTERGKFRLDLYHRIATLRINLAPLRDRPDDIEPIARHFLSQMAAEVGQVDLDAGALNKLKSCPWSGNARELRNVIYRAAALSNTKTLRPEDLDCTPAKTKLKKQSFKLDSIPDHQVIDLLERHSGSVAAAARNLGIPRTSLRDRVKRMCERTANLEACDNDTPMSLVS